MNPDDFLEPEVGVAVVITAALSSPRARRVMRRGIVYGLAGILKAGDALKSMAGDVQQGAAATAGLNDDVAQEARTGRPVRPVVARRAAPTAAHAVEPEPASQ